jgi:murein endopeptidase
MRATPSRFGSLPVPSGSNPASGSGAEPAPGPAANARQLSVLESNHPAVLRTVELLWGHPELTNFIERVAAGLDARLAHIEPAALAELMLLGEIHRSICPRSDRRIDDTHPVGRLGGAWRPAVQRG